MQLIRLMKDNGSKKRKKYLLRKLKAQNYNKIKNKPGWFENLIWVLAWAFVIFIIIYYKDFFLDN